MNEIEIRNVKINEIHELVNLCELHAIYEDCKYDKTNKAVNLKKELFSEKPSLICLVAVKDNKLLGYTSFVKEYSTWNADYFLYMDCLYLLEENRGFGLGKKLINEIIKYKEKLNCTHIQWQTPSTNAQAIKFYKNIGAISKSKERFYLY